MNNDLAADNTKHADLLNNLVDMQCSYQYAARRRVLSDAEQLIVAQERQIEALHAQLDSYRVIGCVPMEDMAVFSAEDTDLLTVYRALPQFVTEWKTIYVKD